MCIGIAAIFQEMEIKFEISNYNKIVCGMRCAERA